MDIAKAKAVKEILNNIETIRELRSFYEKNRIKDVTISITFQEDGIPKTATMRATSITFQEDGIPKTATMRATNALRLGEENIQRLIRYILNGCDAEIKDLENQIGRM